MLISVIIPVYNIEEYVGECIDSVLKQDYKELEIILVDDGSTDSSGKICDEYAQKDSRITVYHIENSGLSGARNYGTDRAHGEFIHYLDGDDCMTAGAISSAADKIHEGIDAVISQFASWNPHNGIYKPEPLEFKDEYVDGLNGDDAFANLLNHVTKPIWSAWRCLFRRSVMVDNNLRFRSRLYSEDLDLMPHLYRKCRGIAVYNRINILYRVQRDGSITNKMSIKLCSDLFDIIERWVDFAKNDAESSDNFHAAMLRQMELRYLVTLKKIRLLPKEDKPEAVAKAKTLSYMLKSKHIPAKYRIAYVVLGFKNTLKLMHSI